MVKEKQSAKAVLEALKIEMAQPHIDCVCSRGVVP